MSAAKETAVSIVREFRRVPPLRAAFERTDPLRRMRRLVQSGLIDAHFYAAQLGEVSISVADAARHYVTSGQYAGLSINPLLDDRTLRRRHGGGDRPPAYEYLWSRSWDSPVSPLWDVLEYAHRHPQALDHPAGPVGHAWEQWLKEPDLLLPTSNEDSASAADIIELHRSAGAEWGSADALRHRRDASPHFTGRESMGSWPDSLPRPMVSIVMPTWNRAGKLRASVESALAQTWGAWELIIVDDGSWDDTAVLSSLLAERDPRIVYMPRPHEGVGAARNAGIDVAKGAFITFLDSDNEWEPHFLENMMVGMREHHAEVAFATIEIDRGAEPFYREAPATSEALELGNVVDLNTLVTTAEALRSVGGFDTRLARAVDYDLVLRLAKDHVIHHIPILGAIYRDREDDPERISVAQPFGWNTLVRQRNLVDLESAREREMAAGTTLVIMLTNHDALLEEKLLELQTLASRPDLTMRLAMIAPTPSEWMLAKSAERRVPGMTAQLFPQEEPYGYVVARTLADADRENFVVIEPSARFTADAAEALIDASASGTRRVVAPLRLHDDGTVATAGATFAKRSAPPMQFLSRHPVEDVARLGPELKVPAVSGRTFGIATRDLLEIGGLDPLLFNEYEIPAMCVALLAKNQEFEFVTLTEVRMRLADLASDFAPIDPVGTSQAIRSVTAAVTPTRLSELYGQLGLEVSHLIGSSTTDGENGTRQQNHLHPVVVRSRSTVIVDGVELPRLRWALRIAAPAFPIGGTWGDTHFARSLAAGLESLGQEVVVDHHDVDSRPTAYLDDVTLVIRGLDRVEPVTGGVSMLWIISHPDQVSRTEAAAFDRVFAASISWSTQVSARWGLPVAPLLQCTDPGVFYPSEEPRREDLVFVGKSRGVARPAVVYPVQADIPVRVFGAEWDGILPDGYVEAEYIENTRLGKLYGRAGAVLNDHWNDMRDQGFISNRLFDVVSAGGRVLSDDVSGIREIFGNAVVTYSSPIELVELLRRGPDDLFPPEEQLREHAARIATDHSFRARARVLLDAAIDQLAGSSVTKDPDT